MIALLLAVAIQAPDPIAVEVKFKELLARVEKLGLAVPELPDGAAELEKLRLSVRLPKDLLDRYEVVRAQATALASLHGHFLKSKGTVVEVFALPKPVPAKIVDVMKRAVRISSVEGTRDIAYADMDAEWVLAAIEGEFSKAADSLMLRGLWLAKAARWEAAFLAFGETATDHPLAVEARKRGVEAAAGNFDALIKGRRWTECLSRLGALEKLAPNDARLATLRGKVLDGIVEHGKEHCRKKAKGPMQELIDFITKHFPDGADRIEDIREAIRWVKVTDPKKFKKLEAAKGPPWLLKAPEDGALTLYTTEPDEEYAGISVKFRFEKGEKKAQGGVAWEGGVRIAWVSAESSNVCVASGKPGEVREAHNFKKVALEGSHTITLRIRERNYVLCHNDDEYDRAETRTTSIGSFALNACYGKVWVEEVWLLKKE